MMEICFDANAYDDYLYWITNDKKIALRIGDLIKDIQRTPFQGIGKPEPLRHAYSGFWSRRINGEHRLVYKIENNQIYIAACRFHYSQ